LALSAVSIMQTLRLPRRSGVGLLLRRRFRPEAYMRYWRCHNAAFCESCAIELLKFKDYLIEDGRWPQWEEHLKQVYAFSNVYLYRLLRMNDEEIQEFKKVAVDHLYRFLNDPPEDVGKQVGCLLQCEGVDKNRIRKNDLMRAAFVTESWLEPFFLTHGYDRIMEGQHQAGGWGA